MLIAGWNGPPASFIQHRAFSFLGVSETMREKISREEVRHVATLARLDLTEEEESRMTEQMNHILSYMDKLNELDTTGVSATTHAIELRNVFRQDEVVDSLHREKALMNAPESDGASFVVPKVI
jgi:aspartyl-tRNA(Asn)/glutamyl-tRNA(Gln) amidotransferase subunit C